MRKVLLFYLLFCMVGCTKEEYAEPKRRINEQVCDYITLLGTLPAEQVAPEMRQTLYSMKDEAHYIKDADKIGDTGEGYYEIELAGIHKRAAMAVTDIVPQINNPSSIYPGALVQGQSVREGNPVLIPLYDCRRAGRISLNVVSGDRSALSKEVGTFTKSEVGDAMNEILSNYTSGFPAHTIISCQTVHNLEEMAYYLDLDSLTLQKHFGEACQRWNTTKVMVKLSQVFFTITYDQPNLNDFFKTNLTLAELQRYCQPGNPPAYISSVSYGRYFVLLYESELVSEPVLASAIGQVYKKDGNVADITPRQRNIFKNKITNVAMLQIGGEAIDNPIDAIARDPDAIRKFIVNGARFTPDNVGAVVGYNVQYLANNQPLVTYRSLDTEYLTLEYKPVKDPNQITLELRGIRVEQIRKLRGVKGDLSYYSRCETRPITITLYDEYNRPTVLGVFNPEIKATTHKNEIVRYYNYILKTDALGITPKHRIVIEGSVKFRNKRLKRQDQTREFPIFAEFRYNKNKEEWEVRYDGNPNPGRFGCIHIYREFAGCTAEFSLDYMFHSSFTTYPKVEPFL